MKLLKVFSLFIVLHIASWGVGHWYFSSHQSQVLVVVDTSYSMKPKFADMDDWISDLKASSRYQTVVVGTDKAMLGELDALKSQSVIFRTAFGRMTEESLNRYTGSLAKQKILLSDGSIQPPGWTLVKF